MGIRFTADEILAIAESIEENGIAFYAAAAEKVPSGNLAELLKKLSQWEMGHVKIFAALRKELAGKEKEAATYDPENEAALYLQAVADGAIFKVDEDPWAALGDQPTPESIINFALGREKDSVAYYTGVKEIVPASLGKERIEEIISEELGHIRQLNNTLLQLRQ
jgi:rubrerythrin